MHRSSYALMVLLWVAALAVPVLLGLACIGGATGGVVIAANAPRDDCRRAACSADLRVLCRTVF